jgi:hypothetical protein
MGDFALRGVAGDISLLDLIYMTGARQCMSQLMRTVRPMIGVDVNQAAPILRQIRPSSCAVRYALATQCIGAFATVAMHVTPTFADGTPCNCAVRNIVAGWLTGFPRALQALLLWNGEGSIAHMFAIKPSLLLNYHSSREWIDGVADREGGFDAIEDHGATDSSTLLVMILEAYLAVTRFASASTVREGQVGNMTVHADGGIAAACGTLRKHAPVGIPAIGAIKAAIAYHRMAMGRRSQEERVRGRDIDPWKCIEGMQVVRGPSKDMVRIPRKSILALAILTNNPDLLTDVLAMPQIRRRMLSEDGSRRRADASVDGSMHPLTIAERTGSLESARVIAEFYTHK